MFRHNDCKLMQEKSKNSITYVASEPVSTYIKYQREVSIFKKVSHYF